MAPQSEQSELGKVCFRQVVRVTQTVSLRSAQQSFFDPRNTRNCTNIFVPFRVFRGSSCLLSSALCLLPPTLTKPLAKTGSASSLTHPFQIRSLLSYCSAGISLECGGLDVASTVT